MFRYGKPIGRQENDDKQTIPLTAHLDTYRIIEVRSKMDKKFINLSRTISHALRHAPQNYNLILDNEGWTDVEKLIQGLKNHSSRFERLTIHDLEELIGKSNKKRFEINNEKIRATYGHSLKTKIYKTPAVPPEFLYHGTTYKAARNIFKTGLKPMGRQYVHLSIDTESAYEVGLRRISKPTVLKIAAWKAHNAGVSFYKEKDNVWLSDGIPFEFIVR